MCASGQLLWGPVWEWMAEEAGRRFRSGVRGVMGKFQDWGEGEAVAGGQQEQKKSQLRLKPDSTSASGLSLLLASFPSPLWPT